MAKKKKANKNRTGPFVPGPPIDDSELQVTPGPPAEPWGEFFARLTNKVNGKGPCPTTEDIRTAIHFWQFYPGFHSQILTTRNTDAMIRLGFYQQGACRIITNELRRRGIKVSAFIKSGLRCREILLFHPEIGDENPRWPDCLGYKPSLIDDEASSVIKEADETLAELIAALGVEDSPAKSAGGSQTINQPPNFSSGMRKESCVMAVLVEHPDWTGKQIAKAAGCHSKSLYRMKRFLDAKKMLRQGREDMPRGTKDHDGNIESYE